jgi:hypothetical protein
LNIFIDLIYIFDINADNHIIFNKACFMNNIISLSIRSFFNFAATFFFISTVQFADAADWAQKMAVGNFESFFKTGKLGDPYDSYSKTETKENLRRLAGTIAPNLFEQYLKLKQARFAVDRECRYNSDRDIYEKMRPIIKDLDIQLEVPTRKLDILAEIFGIQIFKELSLEQIDHSSFYDKIIEAQEGRHKLRAYRTKDGKTLYNYFSEQMEGDYYIYQQILDKLLVTYFDEGISLPTISEIDIKRIQDGFRYNRAGQLFDTFIKTQNGKHFLRTYKNSQWQNLAFIAVKSGNYKFLKHINAAGIDVAEMLREKDVLEQDIFAQTYIRSDFTNTLLEIDANLLITPCFYDGTTPLMLFALCEPNAYIGGINPQTKIEEPGIKAQLELKGLKTDQVDIAGNTADNLAELRNDKDDGSLVFHIACNALKEQSLDENLWEKVMEHPYSHLFESACRYINGFHIPKTLVLVGLNAIISASDPIQMHIRESFLQQNLVEREKANVLWSSFIAKYDALEQQYHERYASRWIRDSTQYQSDVRKEKELPLAIRVLKIATIFEEDQFLNENAFTVVKVVRDLAFNMLSTGGTFGINFNRTANYDEAEAIIESLQSLGENTLRSKISDLFKKLKKDLMDTEKSKRAQAISDFIKEKNPNFKGTATDKKSVDTNVTEYVILPILSRFAREAADEITQKIFIPYSSALTLHQQAVLENHQINCAVIALYAVFDNPIFNTFDEIDKILACRSSVIAYKSSQQRYTEIMGMVNAGYKRSWQSRENEISHVDQYDFSNEAMAGFPLRFRFGFDVNVDYFGENETNMY